MDVLGSGQSLGLAASLTMEYTYRHSDGTRPNAAVYPPGPAFLWVVADGVPGTGIRTHVGFKDDPPVDEAAREHALSVFVDGEEFAEVGARSANTNETI